MRDTTKLSKKSKRGLFSLPRSLLCLRRVRKLRHRGTVSPDCDGIDDLPNEAVSGAV
jgi:hypothetical protein